MCEWGAPSSLFVSLLAPPYMHPIHHNTLLALTGLQPALCFLIIGLNRPPTMNVKGGCVCAEGGDGDVTCSFRPLLK